MAKPRMHLAGFVGKLLEEQDGHALREGIRVLAAAAAASAEPALLAVVQEAYVHGVSDAEGR